MTKDKGKSRGNEASTVYDYHDGSIYDLALKRRIMNGYEQFKVRIRCPACSGTLANVFISSCMARFRQSSLTLDNKLWSFNSNAFSLYGHGNGM